MTDDCQASDIGMIILFFSIFQLINTCAYCCCASIIEFHTILKCVRCCLFLPKRNEEFRISKQEITEEACPECVDEEYLKDHPYISVMDIDKMPSLKFKQFDNQMYANKLKKVELLTGPVEKVPPPKELLKETRFGSYVFSIGLVQQPSLRQNAIIDNIYLNDDIRFAIIAHKDATIDKGIILYTHGGVYCVGSHRYVTTKLVHPRDNLSILGTQR